MHLSQYMEALGLKDEAMAQRLRATGVACDRSTVSRLRHRKQWLSRELAAAMPRATDGLVTAADFVGDAPPASPKKGEAACA